MEGRGGEGKVEGGRGRAGKARGRRDATLAMATISYYYYYTNCTHSVGTYVEVAGVQRMELDTVSLYRGHDRRLSGIGTWNGMEAIKHESQFFSSLHIHTETSVKTLADLMSTIGMLTKQ